jgi:hypothetical protein
LGLFLERRHETPVVIWKSYQNGGYAMTQQKNQPANSPNSRPTLTRAMTLRSLQAQQVMHRSYKKLSQSLFSISVILKIINRDAEEDIEQLDELIDMQFAEVSKDLEDAKARVNTLLETWGVDQMAIYTVPVDYTIVVDSPRASRFLTIIKSLDDLMLLIDTGWLTGEISDKQKKEQTYMWRQRVMKMAGRIIKIEQQARIAASAKGKDEEVAKQAPADTTETDEELAKAVEEDFAEAS